MGHLDFLVRFETVLITQASMDIVVIMLVIAGGLLFYQLAIYQDTDALDRRGNPLVHKRKRFWQ